MQFYEYSQALFYTLYFAETAYNIQSPAPLGKNVRQRRYNAYVLLIWRSYRYADCVGEKLAEKVRAFAAVQNYVCYKLA